MNRFVALLLIMLAVACGSSPAAPSDSGTGTDTPSSDNPTTDVPAVDGPAGDVAPQLDVVAPADVSGDAADAGIRATNAANRGTCAQNSDCDDHIMCTEDTCVGATTETRGRCAYRATPILCPMGQTCDLRTGCGTGRVCATADDCTDRDPCTVGERCDTASRICAYTTVLDGDGDGYASPSCGGSDCRDDDIQAHPGANERCNGQDDNCDHIVDDDPMITLCGGNHAELCRDGHCGTCAPTHPMVCVPASGPPFCANLQADANNCGMCGRSCGMAPDGTPIACVGGVCQCSGLTTLCPEVGCMDLRSDANNCGRCGRVCTSGTPCVAGNCQCSTGRTLCSVPAPDPRMEFLFCADTQTDPAHCGGCGNTCPSGQDCRAGVCACPAGRTRCGASCVDTRSDAANCGGCGVPCGGTCADGVCQCPDDRPYLCGGHCVGPSGRCHPFMPGSCPVGQSCVFTPPGFWACATPPTARAGASCDFGASTAQCGEGLACLGDGPGRDTYSCQLLCCGPGDDARCQDASRGGHPGARCLGAWTGGLHVCV